MVECDGAIGYQSALSTDRHSRHPAQGANMTPVLEPQVRVHHAMRPEAVTVTRPPEETPARWNWQQDAACRGTDGAFFFPPDRERESARTKRLARAKAVCMHCPVIADCRAYALQVGEPFGVWGGLSEEERPQSADRDSKIAELDARSKVPAKRRSSRTAGQRKLTARAS